MSEQWNDVSFVDRSVAIRVSRNCASWLRQTGRCPKYPQQVEYVDMSCGVPKLHPAPWQAARAVADQEDRPPKGAVWRALARAIPGRPPSWSGNARHKTPLRGALEIAFSTPVSPQFLNLRPEQWGRPQLPRRALQSWAASSLAGTDTSTRNRSWPRIVSNGTDRRSARPWWLTP
jgi:hypothetical protein